MKKYVAAAVVALVMFSGCSGNSDSHEGKSVVPAPESVSPSEKEVTQSPTPKPVKPTDRLREAVEAYSALFLTGNGYKAYEILTDECQAKIDKNYFEGITLAAKTQYGHMPIKTYKAKVDGKKASVTYTYANAEINQTDEPWVKTGGRWRNNDC